MTGVMYMSIESQQDRILTYDREIDALNAEINALKREMEQILEAETKRNRLEGAFIDYISREKELAKRMADEERSRVAIGIGSRMNKLLTGSKYRAAVNELDGIKKALIRRKNAIDNRIATCKRKIATLQDNIRYLNNQISRLDGR